MASKKFTHCLVLELINSQTLSEGPKKEDGSSSWLLYDSLRNKYFSINKNAFDLLNNWSSGSQLDDFIKKIEMYEKKYPSNEVPRPSHWSGWRLMPSQIEFWLDGEGRIHERLNYKKEKGNWKKELLYP